jgi:acyl carrier protein
MSADHIKRIIREQLGTGDKPLLADMHLVDDLGADSLDNIELAMAVEEQLGFEITDDELEGCATVGNWLDLIVDKQAAAA